MAPHELRATILGVDLASVHHLTGGAGAPLLFLPPSAFLRVERYAAVLGGFAAGFRVFAPSLPGTNRSGPWRGPWGFEAIAAWAVRYLDAVGVDRATVVAHSTGGGVAIALAAAYPERVDALVLVDTVGDPLGRTPARIFAARARDARLEMPLNLRAWPDPLANLLRHPGSVIDHISMSTRSDLLGHASRIAAPTLLAWGARDRTFPLACARRLQAVIGDATIHVSPTGSHDWLLLEPEAFVAAVRSWHTTRNGA